ncbi:unnamed protein product [Arctogadus glacialis]
MDNDSKEIISIVKRETPKNSVIMEKEAFIRTFETLHQEIGLQEFCTDAHSQISALFMKVEKDYGYIADLQSAILEAQLTSDKGPVANPIPEE